MKKPGRAFEEAVYAFAATLDPSSKVKFDHRVRDRDTGRCRQCDVWIDAKIGGHWPVSILISCKDRRKSGRSLGTGDIEQFRGEIRSTGATMGVIYCNTGFTKPAQEKAKAHQISCCRLYQSEPADMPDTIWFQQYVCVSLIGLELENITNSEAKTWNDIFDVKLLRDDGNITTVLDHIVEIFVEGEKGAVNRAKAQGGFPQDWHYLLPMQCHSSDEAFTVTIRGIWKKYRAKTEAILLDGSYNLMDDSFLGSLTGPLINITSAHPGEHWEEITSGDFTPAPDMIAIRCGLEVEELKHKLRQEIGGQCPHRG